MLLPKERVLRKQVMTSRSKYLIVCIFLFFSVKIGKLARNSNDSDFSPLTSIYRREICSVKVFFWHKIFLTTNFFQNVFITQVYTSINIKAHN